MPKPWVKKVAQEPRCDCGNPAVKRLYSPSGMWTCQRCLDLDRYVSQKHIETKIEQGENNEKWEDEDNGMEGA